MINSYDLIIILIIVSMFEFVLIVILIWALSNQFSIQKNNKKEVIDNVQRFD